MEVVWRDGLILIIHCEAAFMDGFNVYRLDEATGLATKLNRPMSFFSTLEAAQKFAASQAES